MLSARLNQDERMLRVISVQSIPIRNTVEHAYLDAIPRKKTDGDHRPTGPVSSPRLSLLLVSFKCVLLPFCF